MAHRLAGRYLAQRTLFGMKFGLETMRALVEEMGHPERAYPSLLIAGTNGKGSVAAYCDAALRASRLRTGRYTSPHLVRLNERITVGGREITDTALERAVVAVRDAAGRLVKRGTLAAHPRSSRRSPPPRSGTSHARGWTWPCSRWASAAASTRRTSSSPSSPRS